MICKRDFPNKAVVLCKVVLYSLSFGYDTKSSMDIGLLIDSFGSKYFTDPRLAPHFSPATSGRVISSAWQGRGRRRELQFQPLNSQQVPKPNAWKLSSRWFSLWLGKCGVWKLCHRSVRYLSMFQCSSSWCWAGGSCQCTCLPKCSLCQSISDSDLEDNASGYTYRSSLSSSTFSPKYR